MPPGPDIRPRTHKGLDPVRSRLADLPYRPTNPIMPLLMTIDRRDFLKVAGVQAGALLALPHASEGERAAPAVLRRASEVVVIGAGVFGVWTAFHLRRMGASVTLVDMYGPGNSRAT